MSFYVVLWRGWVMYSILKTKVVHCLLRIEDRYLAENGVVVCMLYVERLGLCVLICKHKLFSHIEDR